MKWNKWLGLSVIILLGCEINSFVEDFDKITEPDWNPEFGAPILTGSFNLGDYINEISDSITVYQDDDGVVVFEFEGSEIASDRADEMMSVPEQTFAENISFDVGEVIDFPFTGQLTKSINFDQDVSTEENDQIDSMIFKSGVLGISVIGDFPASGEIEITFNSIELDGLTFSRFYSWDYGVIGPGPNINDQVDLTGAMVDFTKDGTEINNFNFDIDITLNYEGQPLSSANSVDISLTISDPLFQIVYGKFSERTFNTPMETIELGIFDEVDAVDFYLSDPQINLDLKSSFGIPVVVGLNSLIAYDSVGNSIAFTGSIIDDPVSIAAPPVDQIGSTIETSISINNTNSNIADVLAFLPYRIDYEIQGSVDSSTPSGVQYVLDSSQVTGVYSVKMPLAGHVGEFSTEQEFDFDGEDFDFVENGKIVLKTTNGLPITVNLELTFVDVDGNTLFKMFEGTNILNAGEIDASGVVVTPTETTIEEILEKEDLEALKNCTNIIMSSTLFTGQTGTEDVKIRMEDEVKVSLFIQAQLGI